MFCIFIRERATEFIFVCKVPKYKKIPLHEMQKMLFYCSFMHMLKLYLTSRQFLPGHGTWAENSWRDHGTRGCIRTYPTCVGRQRVVQILIFTSTLHSCRVCRNSLNSSYIETDGLHQCRLAPPQQGGGVAKSI